MWPPLVLLFQLFGCAAQDVARPDPRETERPRIAQVVDADTGEPVEGAIVLLAFYLWPKRGFGDWPMAKVFRDSVEAFTDAGGRFSLKGPFDQRSWSTEELCIYKPGYGPWRFRGQENAPSPTTEMRGYWDWRRERWEELSTTGVAIELRPLRTREERAKYVDRGWAVADKIGAGFGRGTLFGGDYLFAIPSDRLVRFQEMVDRERASLGLTPRTLGGTK